MTLGKEAIVDVLLYLHCIALHSMPLLYRFLSLLGFGYFSDIFVLNTLFILQLCSLFAVIVHNGVSFSNPTMSSVGIFRGQSLAMSIRDRGKKNSRKTKSK
jgi:hypothetical protein